MESTSVTHTPLSPVRGWRLFTSDAEFSSRELAWADAPAEDVQVLVIYYDGGRDIEHGEDTFHLPDAPETKHGRLISDELFAERLKLAWAAEPV